jgi:hypothetical protein
MQGCRAWAVRPSLAAGATMLWLLLSALACTSGMRADQRPQFGAGGGSAAGLDPSATAGSAGAPSEPAGGSGAGGSSGGQPSSGSAAVDSGAANPPTDSGARPTDGGLDAAPVPIDASTVAPDASVLRGDQPGCPFVLPEVYGICSGEGLMCEYGMECCPDFAYCEFGQWTLLTHHCDACI